MQAGAVPPKNPYFALGVVGFALSVLAVLNIAGLVISIIALVKSRRRGRLGDGVHELHGATYTCTPTSFNVRRNF